jgi:hypothetical protein
MKVTALVSMLVLLPLGPALGWGQEGHSIVAEIAQRRLDQATLAKIANLLKLDTPEGQSPVSLASIASWADAYTADHPETAGWHFVNIPDDRFTYQPDVDCKNGNCVVDAINRFKTVLADCSKKPEERKDALKFLVHFVGDIHQPLHTTHRIDAYTKVDDQGGNKVPVTFFGTPMTLHQLWDTGLIMRTVHAWGSYVSRLEKSWFPGRDIASLAGGSPAEWALEAHRLAHDVAYDFPDSGVLGTQYLAKSTPVVDRQLALAGVRLAKLLKEAMASCP